MDAKEMIARRAALELSSGEVVNLGYGMPTAVANYLADDMEVVFQSENGCLMFGPTPAFGTEDADIANAGSQPITLLPGASSFDMTTSFCIIRGGHVNTTILGALEVDQEGNIANWATPIVPGRYAPGMGGAMDLVTGAKKVVATLMHVDKKGNSKVKKICGLPLTGKGVVDVIITDKAVFKTSKEGLVLCEIIKELTVDELREITEADFKIPPDLKVYKI